MAGSLLAILSAAALAVLIVPDAAEATCTLLEQQEAGIDLQQQWRDPCFTSWCRRFPSASCETHRCTAQFFVGSTDVTDNCDVDICVVENGPDIECNGVCGIDFLTGRPYCDPSCDIDNGGCSDNEVCVPAETVFCFRAPCPQGIRCIHKTAVCNQEPDTDSCGITERAFFYNPATQLCKRFVYGGCERTHNRFSSMRECRETCRGVTDVCSTSIRCPPGTRCKINDDGTPFCEASCEYDNGGCEIDEICRMRQPQCLTLPCPDFVECIPRREVCALDADVGDCKAAIPRYYHNQQSGRCERFSYGGCGGNENRFITLEECQETCGVESPCNLIDCAPGAICQVDTDGDAECVSITSCLIRSCPTGFSCERDPATNMAECVPISITIDPCEFTDCDPCRFDPCKPGTTCELNSITRDPECVPIDLCSNFPCAGGFTCEMHPVTNEPRCVPEGLGCALIFIHCLPPAICRIRRGTRMGYCGGAPCETHNCGRGFECRYNQVEDAAECVPSVITNDPCVLKLCQPGTECEVTELGTAVCRPTETPCALILCDINSICRMRPGTNDGYCGPHPCNTHVCEGTECRLNRELDIAECVPTDPCLTTVCRPGTTCVVNELGAAVCRLANPCIAALCAVGTVCEVDPTGSPVCIPVPHPCATIECRKPEICRVRPSAQRGYCGVDPCIKMNCGKNYECSYNEKTDEGECVPTAPCLLQHCPTGQVCKLNEDTGEGVCSPPDLRCMIFDCPKGTVCQPKKGIKTTVECFPENPCSRIDCGLQLCRIDQVSGRGYCGIDPCTLVRCSNCRYNPETDGPQCMRDPCATILCSEGTTCRVDEDGEPECVSPCEDIICGSLMCRVNLDTNAEYCGLDPCTYTTCEAGTQCRFNMKLDAAECVAVNPCATMDCAEGTTCQVDASSGEARCVLDLPDIRCFLLQCAAGFVCQANEDGSVECVPEDPCSDRNCGQLMCRVRPDTRRAYCGLDPCTFTTCREGTECRYNPDLDIAVCVNPTDPCADFSCTGGDICRVNVATGLPFCGITPCAFTTCFVNTVCIYDPTTDSARCAAPPDPCDGFSCSGGDICRVNQATQEPFCGVDLCTIISCAPNSRCNHDPLTDLVICEEVIISLPDACNNVQCAPWTRCEVNERSVAECAPICSDILCGRPLVCRINATTREPYCGNFACRNFRCTVPGTECQYDYETDEPRCSFVDNSPGDVCSPDPCPFNFACVRNSRGNAECLLLTIG